MVYGNQHFGQWRNRVGNIMYSSAKERTREIGIRKSVGAKAQQIKAMFLWESIALTSLAGYVGLVLGWGY